MKAWDIYQYALNEIKSPDPLARRDAAEKGWLAVTEAVDTFLALHFKKLVPRGTPKAHGERLAFLEDAADIEPDVIGLSNLVSEAADKLHGTCFYLGTESRVCIRTLKETVRKILERTGDVPTEEPLEM